MFVFFRDPVSTEIYTLSLHDALPILRSSAATSRGTGFNFVGRDACDGVPLTDRCCQNVRFSDRKSTRLNSSHRCISYAVFCLKKKTRHCLRENNHSVE